MKFSIRSRILALLLLPAFLYACASASKDHKVNDDSLLISESFSLKPPPTLTKSELKEDMDVLTYAFENGYGGRNFLPSVTLQMALSDFSTVSGRAPESSDTKRFCSNIAQLLLGLPDNHLSARLNGEDCSEEHEKFSSGGSVGKNVSQIKNRPWDVNYKTIEKFKIPIVSLIKMLSHEDKAWHGFLDTITALKATAPALVIDLRGNGGGDDTMGREMAKVLYGQAYPSPWESFMESQTPATLALSVNGTLLKIYRLKQGKGIASKKSI